VSPEVIGEPQRHRFVIQDGRFVPVAPDEIEAGLEAVRRSHPELVRPAKTEAERNELTAAKFAGMRRARVGPWQVVPVRNTCPATRRRGSSRQIRPTGRRTRSSARSTGRQSDDPSEPPPPPELTALQLGLADLHRLDQRRQVLGWREWRALVDIVAAWVAHENAKSIDDEWAST
jgi:hypothetical protein